MNYQQLDWHTLEFFKAHLYRRLLAPLNKALAQVERLQVMSEEGNQVTAKLNESQHHLESVLNLLNAWAALITYKESGPLSSYQLKDFTPDKVPAWFKAYLEQHTLLRVEFSQTVHVHPEAFIEAILLLYHVISTFGTVANVQIIDAPADKPGLYMRVVFTTHPDQAPFVNLAELANRFDQDDPTESDTYVQFMVATDLLALNNAHFTLQNNKKTGQQALAAYFAPQAKSQPAPIFPAEGSAMRESALATLLLNQVEAPPVIQESLKTLLLKALDPQADDSRNNTVPSGESLIDQKSSDENGVHPK